MPVHFAGCLRALDGLRERGLRLPHPDGPDRHAGPLRWRLHEEPPAGLWPELGRRCVESGATAEAAAALALTLPEDTAVVRLLHAIADAMQARAIAQRLH
jgi:2-dehydropantoate 2-reductase